MHAVKILAIILLILIIAAEVMVITRHANGVEVYDRGAAETIETIKAWPQMIENAGIHTIWFLDNQLEQQAKIGEPPYRPTLALTKSKYSSTQRKTVYSKQLTNVSSPDQERDRARTEWGFTEGDVINGVATHYDVCVTCCGKTNGVTASGITIQNGVEPEKPIVACGWLPFGTIIDVDGVEYVVADRGSGVKKVGRVDIFVPDGHEAALKLGRKSVTIKIVSFSD